MHWKIIVLGCWLFCRVHIQLSPHFPTLYHCTLYHWMLFNVGNQQNVFVKRWGRNEGSHSNEKREWSEVSLSEKRKSSSARNHGNYMPNSTVVKLYWNCKPTFIPVWEIFVALVCICQKKIFIVLLVWILICEASVTNIGGQELVWHLGSWLWNREVES